MQAVASFLASAFSNKAALVKAACSTALFLFLTLSGNAVTDVRAAETPILCEVQETPDEPGSLCHEILIFLTRDEAMSACLAKVALFNQNVGCNQVVGQPSITAFTLHDPENQFRKFIISYGYAEFCQEPAMPNPDATTAQNACVAWCRVDRPFVRTIRDCLPEHAAAETEECETCNPINFSTGDKYLVESDYTGSGAFPLNVTRFYHSQRGREYDGRRSWVYEQAAVPMVAWYEPKVLFTSQRKYSPRTKVQGLTQVLKIEDPVQYRGRDSSKWGHRNL